MKQKRFRNYTGYIILHIIASLLTVGVAYSFTYLIDNIITPSHYDLLWIWGTLTILLSIVASLLSFYFIDFVEVKLSLMNTELLTGNVLQNILHMAPKFYQKKRNLTITMFLQIVLEYMQIWIVNYTFSLYLSLD